MLPGQLPDLTIPWCMQKSHPCDRGGRRLAFSYYKWGEGGDPIAHLFLHSACFFFLASPLCCVVHGTDTKVFRRREGKSPPRRAWSSHVEEEACPPSRCHRQTGGVKAVARTTSPLLSIALVHPGTGLRRRGQGPTPREPTLGAPHANSWCERRCHRVRGSGSLCSSLTKCRRGVPLSFGCGTL